MNPTQIKAVIVGIFIGLFVLLLLPSHARYEYMSDGMPCYIEMKTALSTQVFAVCVVAAITALTAYRWRTQDAVMVNE